MDNLKSPYWEVYFWIIVIAIGIAGTAVIFIDPMGLASKFGNAGSFLGGLFTIAAVVIAVITYKTSKKEHRRNTSLNWLLELEQGILPLLEQQLSTVINMAATAINHLQFPRDNSDISEAWLELIEKQNQSLRVLGIKLSMLIGRLEYLNYVNVKYSNYFTETLELIDYILYSSKKSTGILKERKSDKFEKIKLKFLSEIEANELHKKYIVPITFINILPFPAKIESSNEDDIKELILGIRKYIDLKSN
ncbi:hypothetical protein [Pseudoalteromonas sp. NZS100]|uniref:hypothetical protein n=1 Tax=Pseudoalteromonas sp. NZS100 TaxID=2792046 RepID=UPI0018CFC3AC|nr:hypothetical protein [Pseudoalteromonas sp. NZS100]MBH0069335.1 hypothetical protein [Pseudoalteromonas sp. NZS100]